MLDNNTVYFLNIIWTYCTCMYYVSEINEYYYYYNRKCDVFGTSTTIMTVLLTGPTISATWLTVVPEAAPR